MKKIYFFTLSLFLSIFMISAVAQTVINTQNLSLDVVNKGTYAIDSVQFNLTQTLTDLGITALSEAVPVARAGNGTYSDVSNEGSGGFFIGSADTIAGWGAGGVVYITHFMTGDGWVGVGQFPDSLTAYIGQSLTFTYGFKANDKIELLSITLNISKNPEITGTIINTQDLNLDVYVKPNYSLDSVQFDLTQTLTDLDISSLDEATVIAYNEDGSYTDASNENSGGFFLGSAGYKKNWGQGGIVYVTHFDITADGYVGVGQFPDSLGLYAYLKQPFTVKYGFLANEKIEMLAITINPVPYTQEISIDVVAKSNYEPDSFQYDLDKTLADLEISSIDEATVITIMADGSHDTVSNEDGGGFWLSHDGYKANWGAGGLVYVFHSGYSAGYAGIGQFPDGLNEYKGQSFTVMYGFFANAKIEMLEITVNVEGGSSVNPKDAIKQGIMIFNNPVQDELKVAVSRNGSSVNGTITIYSITGAKVLSRQVSSETETFDLGHLSGGLYLLDYDNGLKRETIKFIKH